MYKVHHQIADIVYKEWSACPHTVYGIWSNGIQTQYNMVRVAISSSIEKVRYPRYAVYPVPYLRFLTVYDRIWTVFAGGTPQTRVQFLAKAFLLFWSIFFSRGFLN